MNLRDLSYIQALARTGHFGQAAELCNISQPTLSSQIKKLETELGVTLFERDNRSVRLTDVGREIVDLAGDALSSVDNIRVTAKASSDPLSGEFNLGTIPTIAPYIVSQIFNQARGALPNLSLKFREDITDSLNHALLSGEIDAAILATPPETSKFDVIPLYDEPFWVIYPKDHSLDRISRISTANLPPDELLLLTEGHCFRDQALDLCELNAAPEKSAIRVTSLETLVSMVIAGMGVTLVPVMALGGRRVDDPAVRTQKLIDSAAYRRVYLTFRKTFPRRDLLETLADLICASLPDSVAKVRSTSD